MRIPITQIYSPRQFGLLAVLLAYPLVGLAQAGHAVTPPGPVKPFSTGVAAQGRIVPSGGVVRVAAASGVTGQAIVEQLSVNTGDVVEANQLLATLRGHSLAQAQSEQAEREENAAGAVLTQANASLLRSEFELQAQLASLEGRAAVADANVRQAVMATATALNQAMRDESAAQNALAQAQRALQTGQAASAATVATAQAQLDAIPARSHDAEHKIASAQLDEAKAAKLHTDAQLSAQVEQAQAQADIAALRTQQAQADLVVEPATDASKLMPVQAEAQAAHAAVESEYKLTDATLAEIKADIGVAQARLDAAEDAQYVAHTQIALNEVHAPSAGKVLTILARPGEAVGPAGLLQLGDTREMYVDALVYIDDILGVHIGQKTMTTGSALPDEGVSGTVVEISPIVAGNTLPNLDPTVFSDQPVVLVKVKLDAPSPAANVINGQVKVQFAP